MFTFTALTETETAGAAYGFLDLNVPEYEKEFDLGLEEMEEAAAYRSLVAGHGYRLGNVNWVCL